MLLSAKAAAGRQQRSEPAYVAVAEASYVKKEGGHVIEAPTETKARGLAALEVLRKALEEATGANVNKPTTAALTTLARLAVQIDQQREEATLATERANRAERASIRASTILEQASASSAAGGGGDGGRLAESVRILEASVAAAPAEYMSSDFKVALARIQVLEMRLQEVETAAMEEARAHGREVANLQRSLDQEREAKVAERKRAADVLTQRQADSESAFKRQSSSLIASVQTSQQHL